jgi:predicted nucleic-acid-binding Zn-ribbon protein
MAATNNAQEVWQSFDGEDFLHLLGLQGGTIVAYVDATGAWNGTGSGGGAIFSPTISSATPATQRVVDAEPTITATSAAISGSVVGVRGNATIATGTTVTSGFIYGVQGKLTVKGTYTDANFSAGLLGQLDLSAATAISTGRIAAIWADAGATFSAGAITGEAIVDLMLLTNTAPGTAINSVFHVEANATYLIDASNVSYAPFYDNHVPTTLSGSFAVNTPNGVRYIALYTTQ